MGDEKTKKETVNESIWKLPQYKELGAGELKSLTLREDMYSMSFISFVKPQYKMYCDLVAKTGKPLPCDDKEIENIEEPERNVMEKGKNWCE